MKSWLLPALILACLFYLGWKILRVKDPARLAQQDREALGKWRALRARGFWRFLLKDRSGFFIPYVICTAFADTWRSRSAVFPTAQTMTAYAALALLLTLLTAWLDWRDTKKRAAEAASRLGPGV